MKYGFVKTAAVSPKIRVADTEYNAQETIRLMREAWEKGARIIVFPELGITGYTCSDLFRQDILLEGAQKALQEIVAASKGMDGLFFAGLPLEINGKLLILTDICWDWCQRHIFPITVSFMRRVILRQHQLDALLLHGRMGQLFPLEQIFCLPVKPCRA